MEVVATSAPSARLIMGRYADNLSRRLREQKATKAALASDTEWLVSVAISRGGTIHSGLRSHYELRSSLGDESPHIPNPDDIEGFMTSEGRFVGRREAQDVAIASGQLSRPQGRPLLSSDIEW